MRTSCAPTDPGSLLNVNPSTASIVVGRAGNDTITGGSLTDIICGGFGNDTLAGAAGADALYGGFGKDRLTGGAGADLFSGGFGIDSYVDVDASAGDVAWPFLYLTTRDEESHACVSSQRGQAHGRRRT